MECILQKISELNWGNVYYMSSLSRYKRLMFGICSAPELFQKVMESIVAGLEGVVIYLDDVLVTGRNQTEHDIRLKALLSCVQHHGILLNEKKCVYNVSQIEFVGHVLSSSGIRPTESRIAAIERFREPRNISELRSFLGLVTYVGRFIPSLADKTEPLRKLLRTGEKFIWKQHHSQAFEGIKASITETDFLGYYDTKDLCIVIADASPTGLGAVLLQQDHEGRRRIISFASKALTETERKYFQTEREALALVWAVDRFHLYLLGTHFKLVTDCKPLLFLFSERSKPCARIERWVLRLQTYKFSVIYESGANNLADALSRLSISEPIPFNTADEACILQLAITGIPCAITVQEVENESLEDAELQNVIRCLETGDWNTDAKDFKPFASELCRVNNLLLRGDRLVIPANLKTRMLDIAHEAHPGMVTMKRRLRQKVWWPLLDMEVEAYVKRCKQCTLVSAPNPPEPLIRTELPDQAWTDLAIDFVGPLPSGHNLLVIIDYFSRFTEVIIMRQTTASLTVKALHETFCRFGMPDSIKSDNGPQFVSGELQQFCKQFGIEHRKTTPYWPQANGEVERFNRSIVKRLKISQETSGSDWQWDLRTFILMHNSTPHSTTGTAPSILMFGRKLKDKLPGLLIHSSKILEEVQDRDRVQKMKGAEYADRRRRAEPSDIKEGDVVVTKRVQKDNKLSTSFDPEEYIVLSRSGSDVTLKSKEGGRVIHRNVSHLKKLVSDENCNPDQQEPGHPLDKPDESENPDGGPSREVESTRPRAVIDYQLSTQSDERPRDSRGETRPRRESKCPSYLKDYKVNNLV